MSVQSQIDRIKTAVESAYAKLKSKGATLPATLTVENLADCADTIFPAFYSYNRGSGGTTLVFKQVPFECNLISIMIRWGISNSVMVNNSVFSVIYDGESETKSDGTVVEHNRYRRKLSSTGNVPQEVPNAVTVTNTKDSDGTYTVSVYCNGSVFPSSMDYVCFLAKKQG